MLPETARVNRPARTNSEYSALHLGTLQLWYFDVIFSGRKSSRGPVAQLGARFHGMEEVKGSNPFRSTGTPVLYAAQLHVLDSVIFAFFQDEMCALTSRTDVLTQVRQVYFPPDPPRGLDSLGLGEQRVAVEVR